MIHGTRTTELIHTSFELLFYFVFFVRIKVEKGHDGGICEVLLNNLSPGAG